MPNALGPIIVSMTFTTAIAIGLESTISFFGLGISPVHASWGSLLSDSKGYILSGKWWLVLYPCLVLLFTVLSVNFIGDGLRDALDPEADAAPMTAVLEIENLTVSFPTDDGPVQAVRGVSLDVDEGEVLAVVGESGSGKSVTFLAAMGLLPKSAIITGSVKVRGQELIGVSKKIRAVSAGQKIAMIFQDPLSALNPVHKVGNQVSEMVLAHQDMSRDAARQGHRVARPRRHPAAEDAGPAVPARVLRRHAAARDDRHGHRQRARRCSSPTSRRRRSTSPCRRRSSR